MMLYKTKEAEHEERETAAMANGYGIDARILSQEEVQSLEPEVKVNVRGGILFPGDAHLTPQIFMNGLRDYLKEKSPFKLIPKSQVSKLKTRRSKPFRPIRVIILLMLLYLHAVHGLGLSRRN